MPTPSRVDAKRVQEARRELVRALAAGRPEPLAVWLETHRLQQEDLVWLHRQGLGVFGFYRLQQADLLDRLPEDLVALWQDTYYQMSVTSATLDWEIERVLMAVTQAGVEFIWMKGAALAYTVYPNPACRARGDLDLWIRMEDLSRATVALEGLGYHLKNKEDRPEALILLVGGEQQMVGQGLGLELIELQWPAIRSEWVRHTTAVDHAGIWQRRLSMIWGDKSFCIMAPEDALIHLCVHQAINHQFGMSWLRNLLDIHLLVTRYELDWSQVAARASQWRLATVVWTVLSLAQRLLGTAAPDAFLQSLSPPRWQRWLINRLRLEEALLVMRPGVYDHRRFLIQMAMVDRLRDGAALLLRGLFPEAAWLQARYGVDPGQALWRWRFAHLWRLATSARA